MSKKLTAMACRLIILELLYFTKTGNELVSGLSVKVIHLQLIQIHLFGFCLTFYIIKNTKQKICWSLKLSFFHTN